MKKRYLGIICLLYSGIIAYVWLFDKLKDFLAPQMQIYLKISLIPMIIMGLIILFDNKVHYKFKISDLILIIPIIMLIFAGDGRLTASFANNRMIKFNVNQRTKIEVLKEEIPNDESNKTYDFSNVDFDVKDASYVDLSNYIGEAPQASVGKTIRVRGLGVKYAYYLPNGFMAIGKYAITCCAADAGLVGFLAKYDIDKIKYNGWYEIEGVLENGKDKEGYDIVYIKVINIKEIDSQSEEQYVYPCYAYDNGLCAESSKYDFEY